MQFSRDIKWPRQSSNKISVRSFLLALSGLTCCAPAGYLSGLAREASRLGPERLKLDESSLTENFFDIWVKGFWYCLMYLPVIIIAFTPVFLVLAGFDTESVALNLISKLINFAVSVIGFIWLPLIYLREITRQDTEDRYDYAAIWKLLKSNVKQVFMLALINVAYSAIFGAAVIIDIIILTLLGVGIAFAVKISPIIGVCVGLLFIAVLVILCVYTVVLMGYMQIAFACAVGFHVYENGLGDGFVKTDLGYDYSSGSRMEAGAFGVPDQVGAADNQYNANNFAPAANPAPVASFTPVGVGIAENPNENIEINIGDGTDRYY